MRIAHITDLHVESPPSLMELVSKRLIGATNLYLLGRKSHFTEQSQDALVQKLQALAPDAIVCTGDLTALATETEFERARTLLAPLLKEIPFFTIAGNHDLYTAESKGRFEKYFDPWSETSRVFGGMTFYGLPVCRADWLSRGLASPEALTALQHFLESDTTPVAVMLHYPLRNRMGEPYGPWTRALENAAQVEAILAHPRVKVVLHGHEHHGYQTQIPTPQGVIRSLNPGASGYGYLPEKKRTAHFNLYTLLQGDITEIERFAFNGSEFSLEAGGAYATGG